MQGVCSRVGEAQHQGLWQRQLGGARQVGAPKGSGAGHHMCAGSESVMLCGLLQSQQLGSMWGQCVQTPL